MHSHSGCLFVFLPALLFQRDREKAFLETLTGEVERKKELLGVTRAAVKPSVIWK
jgi:hypothetical protein